MSTIKADITLSPDLQAALDKNAKSNTSLMDVATIIVASGASLFAILLGVSQLLRTILMHQKPPR